MKPLPDLSGRVTLRPQEAASIGVSLNTLLSWRSIGMPHVMIGRCLLVPVAELRTWLSGQIVPSGHEQQSNSAGLGIDHAGGTAEFGAGAAENE